MDAIINFWFKNPQVKKSKNDALYGQLMLCGGPQPFLAINYESIDPLKEAKSFFQKIEEEFYTYVKAEVRKDLSFEKKVLGFKISSSEQADDNIREMINFGCYILDSQLSKKVIFEEIAQIKLLAKTGDFDKILQNSNFFLGRTDFSIHQSETLILVLQDKSITIEQFKYLLLNLFCDMEVNLEQKKEIVKKICLQHNLNFPSQGVIISEEKRIMEILDETPRIESYTSSLANSYESDIYYALTADQKVVQFDTAEKYATGCNHDKPTVTLANSIREQIKELKINPQIIVRFHVDDEDEWVQFYTP